MQHKICGEGICLLDQRHKGKETQSERTVQMPTKTQNHYKKNLQ
ncbi:unnamed protein product [Gulo gulo]|uniref:Uncharacterized protein n=1 Tax=Gulo gulo TaxID=48420 RepID=A0A9X9MC07_GULGU|nr:unnamed protein product [Gulo gulo]